MSEIINKLELRWIDKYKKIEIEPRILIENKAFSYKSKPENSTNENENILIHGDNLLALKVLEQDYAGKVKCIYIDPPYNTRSAFDHYDDNLEHSIWLNLMKIRLNLLKNLLSYNGFIFVQIDDNEQAYLTVLMDEIFGRKNRINTIALNMSNMSGVKVTAAINGKRFPKIKEYILMYCKDKSTIDLKIPKINKGKWDKEYNLIIPEFSRADYEDLEKNFFDSIERKLPNYTLISLNSYLRDNNIEATKSWLQENAYRIVASKPNHALLKIVRDLTLPNSDLALVETARGLKKIIKTQFNRDTKTARLELVFAETANSVYVGDYWNDIVTTGGVAQEGGVVFQNGKKPEKLISRIIECCTEIGDYVLDSFLGSGTTAAVAHKMRRHWIGIEMGEHAYTHCKVRLDNVIEGEQGGISKSVNWQGGGGYKFYELAPSLMQIDQFGNYIISKEYNADMLAAAIAKHEGFIYQPNKEVFWKQAYSSEKTFLFTTTIYISQTYIDSIKNQMKEDEYLIIACKSFESNLEKKYRNITIKKIPNMLLGHCEFGVDNYNLNIVNPPIYEEEEDE